MALPAWYFLHDLVTCGTRHNGSRKSLGSITTNKASGGDGIPAELLQILKDDAIRVLHSIYQQIWKIQLWPQTVKGSLPFQFQRKAMPKNVQNTIQLCSFHMLAS